MGAALIHMEARMPHTGKPNPRYANGSRRRAIRDRWRSLGAPCAICGGDIDYSLPAGHPMSFEVDEIVPVSRWKEGGYASAEACALDFRNTQPTHRLPSLQPA